MTTSPSEPVRCTRTSFPTFSTAGCGSWRLMTVVTVAGATWVSWSNCAELSPTIRTCGRTSGIAVNVRRVRFPKSTMLAAKRSSSPLSADCSGGSRKDCGMSTERAFAFAMASRGRQPAPLGAADHALAERVAADDRAAGGGHLGRALDDVVPALELVLLSDLPSLGVDVARDDATDDVPNDEVFPARHAVEGVATGAQIGENRQIPGDIGVSAARGRQDCDLGRLVVRPGQWHAAREAAAVLIAVLKRHVQERARLGADLDVDAVRAHERRRDRRQVEHVKGIGARRPGAERRRCRNQVVLRALVRDLLTEALNCLVDEPRLVGRRVPSRRADDVALILNISLQLGQRDGSRHPPCSLLLRFAAAEHDFEQARTFVLGLLVLVLIS